MCVRMCVFCFLVYLLLLLLLAQHVSDGPVRRLLAAWSLRERRKSLRGRSEEDGRT